jgi:hypothetical protein
LSDRGKSGRWEFEGTVAKNVCDLYFGKSVRSYLGKTKKNPNRQKARIEPEDDSVASQYVQAITEDGLALHGWYLPGKIRSCQTCQLTENTYALDDIGPRIAWLHFHQKEMTIVTRSLETMPDTINGFSASFESNCSWIN